MALLEPDVREIAPPAPQPSEDRAPDWVAAGTPQPLRGELEALLGADRVLARASDIVRYASDASPYRLFPKAGVMAHDADDVGKLPAFGRRQAIPITFRAGGATPHGPARRRADPRARPPGLPGA